jgi:hypothetical protein
MRKLACSFSAALAVIAGVPLTVMAAPSGVVSHESLQTRSNLPGEAAAQDVSAAAPIGIGPRASDGVNGNDVQVNNPALDYIFAPTLTPPTRPYEFATQSETTVASFGSHVVVAYNSSAGVKNQQVGNTVVRVQTYLTGFSSSHDGGITWTSGFAPPVPGKNITAGDPAIAVDRAGNFYLAHLDDIDVIVSKSTDQGSSFAPAVIAAVDPGSDKEWIAVGPDPNQASRDNVYVTWTSFKTGGSELWMTMSKDAGLTWTTKKLFAPVDGGPTGMSSYIQFSNPVVDLSSGRLYVPFLHFSNFDADFIKVLVSDDGGSTFSFLPFNVPGAPDPFGYPNVTPGTVADCGTTGGVREILHQGPNLGGGRFGLPRYRQATRLITQPSTAAAQGRLFIAFNSSTSPIGGDPNSRSEIKLLYSANAGGSWAPVVTVVPATAADPQHVHPSISVDGGGAQFYIGHYAQQSDERLRVDLSRGQVDEGGAIRLEAPVRVSTTDFDLTPSNIPIPAADNPYLTTNFDRIIRPCYDIGEYMATLVTDNAVLNAWGDNRNPWTSPPDSPAAGEHAQPDVFYRRLEP